MKVDWNQTAAGATLKQVRRLMMALHGKHPEHFTANQFATMVRTWPDDQERPDGYDNDVFATNLLHAMAASDLLAIAYDARMRPLHGRFVFSDTGISLTKSMPQRYTRAEADIAVQGMLAAVQTISHDPTLMYDVSRLAIYGSYLDEGDDLGDVDVSFELKPRHEPQRTRSGVTRLLAAHPMPRGHAGDWAEDATLAVLIGRTGIRQDGLLQLTPWSNAQTMGWRMRLIHPETRDIPATRPAQPRPPIRLVDGDASALERLADDADALYRTWEEKLHREWQQTGWLDVDHLDLTGAVTRLDEIVVDDDNPAVALDIMHMSRKIVAMREAEPLDEKEDRWIIAGRQDCDTTVKALVHLMRLGVAATGGRWAMAGTVSYGGRSVRLLLDIDKDDVVISQVKTGERT